MIPGIPGPTLRFEYQANIFETLKNRGLYLYYFTWAAFKIFRTSFKLIMKFSSVVVAVEIDKIPTELFFGDGDFRKYNKKLLSTIRSFLWGKCDWFSILFWCFSAAGENFELP